MTWARRHLQARDEGNHERGLLGAVCGHVLRAAVAVVLVQDGDGAIGSGAMTQVV
jgi:hypothetical protein